MVSEKNELFGCVISKSWKFITFISLFAQSVPWDLQDVLVYF